ncbi:MAG: HAD hydrolase-like protein [Roseburia sp.]
MKAVLLDLDGTLINSEEGITKCVQYALRSFGIEENDLSKLRCFIGPPLDVMYKEKYGFTDEQAWEGTVKYRERFDVKGIFECELYEGVEEALIRLKELGYKVALASSKPEVACKRIIEHFGLTKYFDEIVGSTLDGSISSKGEVLEELYRRMPDVEKSEMCLVGDTKFDVLGAKEFGIDCIGVSYGFGTKEDLEAAGAVTVCVDLKEVLAYLRKVR